MRIEEKKKIVDELVDNLNQYNNFYITDISELTVEDVNLVRRKCFEKNIKIQVIKNTLIKRALSSYAPSNQSEIEDQLVGTSSVMFSEDVKSIALTIKNLNKELPKPLIKVAYVNGEVYVGHKELDNLVAIKSKEELLAEIIMLLESPIKSVLGALQSGQNTLSGLMSTLEKKQ